MPDTWYSVVINNPTPEDEKRIQEARDAGWQVEGQLEVGKSGTPHYQLAVKTDSSWKEVKTHFPRANIEEARDPSALRKYVVKTETRAVDLTTAPKPRCKAKAITNLDFYEGLLCTATTMGISFSELQSDTSMTHYDRIVAHWMEDASTAQFAMELATRAIRPDVRAIYRRYRSALINLWTPSDINLPMVKDQDADEDEVSGDEDTEDEQSEPSQCSGEDQEDTEAEGTEADSSDGEDDSVSGQ
nr:MAG: replication associated protein [Cressdnaviricota sp.]